MIESLLQIRSKLREQGYDAVASTCMAKASVAGILLGQVTDTEYDVRDVIYSVHQKRGSPSDAPRSMRVDYRLGLNRWQSEYVCVEHSGFPRHKAKQWWKQRSKDPVPDTAERDDQDRLTEIDWVYDDLGRLVQEDYDSHDNALDYTADYLFDVVGNRVEKRSDTDGDTIVDEVITYLYDDNDRLLTETKDAAGMVDDRHTMYEYGPNAVTGTFGGDWTVETKKTVYEGLDDTGTKLSETISIHNLQGRLEQVDIDSDGDGNIDSSSTYTYNDQGICTSQTVALDTNDDGTVDTTTTTDYVIDNNNHTGYAQVLEEKVAGTVEKTYTIGHDVIGQQAPADASGSALLLLPDGHGSTRQLVDDAATPAVVESYSYDAYGNAIGFDAAAALTTLLYSGEQTDRATGQQYLRARYYDTAIGRFNRLDPFAGGASDPQSLHKYLYAHADPINLIDPTGLFGLGSVAVGSSIGAQLNAIQGQTGQNVAELTLSVIAGASAGQAIGFMVAFELAGAGIPFFGNAIGTVIGTIGNTVKAGAANLGRFLPMHRQGEFILPGILKLTGSNSSRYFDQLFDSSFASNAGNATNLKRNLAEMYGGNKSAFDSLNFTVHHLIPSALANNRLLQRIGFNVDAALNAFPIQRNAHGWSRPHRGYSEAVKDILDLIEHSGRTVAEQREMVLETMAKASATILEGNTLQAGVRSLGRNDWAHRLMPTALQ